MTTLTSTVDFWKKGIRYIAFALVGLILVLIILRLGQFLINKVAPPPPPPATIAFGKLPSLDLSEGIKPLDDTNYLVETITGNLPNLAANTKVFAIGAPTPTFGKLENAQFVARRAGFAEEPIEISQGQAKFVSDKNNQKFLSIGTVRNFLKLESNYLSDSTFFNAQLKSQERVRDSVIRFYDRLDVPIKDFPEDKISKENYKIAGGILEESISLSDANLVKIVFNRSALDELPIINADILNPLVWGLSTDNEVVAGEYLVNNIKKHEFSLYPLKGTVAAFEDLENGKGMLNKKQTINVFPIRGVKLGYIETKVHQDFLQPVYIFVSDDGLVAYVGAVSDLFIEKQAT